ncbi:MAG: hypothetical protein HQK54_02250 [Oligoflexales bacterium]|nr:hypothetical protein [Oligoflexales bacterium]
MLFTAFMSAIASMFFIFAPKAEGSPKFEQSSGIIPRSAAGSTEIDLTLVIKDIDPLDVVSSDVKKTIFSRLSIYLDDHPNSSLRIKYSEEPASTVKFLDPYTVSIASEPIKEGPTNGLYKVTISLTVRDNGATDNIVSLLAKHSGEYVKVTATYKDQSNVETSSTLQVYKQKGVANKAPELQGIYPLHKSVYIAWTKEDLIPYNADGLNYPPKGVNIIVIDTSIINSMVLPAKTYREKKEEEIVDSQCTFSITGETCKVDCRDYNTHLDIESLEQISKSQGGFRLIQKAPTVQSAIISDIIKDRFYAIFMAYEPDGLLISRCLMGKSYINVSLTEANGAKEAKAGNPACFIATAAYGTPYHKDLDLLRWFRDKYLLEIPYGHNLVSLYYKYSPSLALKIENHDLLKKIVKAALFVPVKLISFLRKMDGDERYDPEHYSEDISASDIAG